MVPLDGPVADVILAALYNCDAFEWPRFRAWLVHQPGDIQALARKCPPDRIYRLAPSGHIGVVMGYRTGSGGAPAMCAVYLLGVREGEGSPHAPVFVEGSALEDVTPLARARKLQGNGKSGSRPPRVC
jgi:hypothetical protein